MAFRPEHSKRDQNLQFTLLRESKSPNELLTRGGSSPSSYGSPSGPRTMAVCMSMSNEQMSPPNLGSFLLPLTLKVE